MKHTVRYLLGLLIVAVLIGMTACSADDATEHAAPTLEWYTAAAPVSSDTAARSTTDSPVPTATTGESTNTASTAAPATATATAMTTEITTTAPEPIVTAAEPVTTPKPITTTVKPATSAAPLTAEPQGACDYLLNTKSMKFHTPDCGNAKTIKDENREAFSGTWEELVAKGYSPCGNCDPTGGLTAAPETTRAPEAPAEPQSGVDYILNTKSMKFHAPGCGSAKNIKEENRAEFSGTRDALIAKGYDPCGNCKP